METMEYLKERLACALVEAAVLSKKIREEERRTAKLDVRIVVESKGIRGTEWMRMVLAHHVLTLEQRDKMIGNIRNT